jgi:hypothetical protein
LRLLAAGFGGVNRPQRDRAGNPLRRVAAWRRALDQRVGVLQHGQRGDHRHVVVVGHQVVAQRLQLGDPVGVEQLGDRVAVVHRDQPEHRLAAEQVLIGDVVDVDLVVLVEVAVLSGGELQTGDAEPEDERDDQPDEGDEPGPLAHLDGQP